MFIATMTFHWSANYGAVLQAYALQKYLQLEGYNTEIIDYRPVIVLVKQAVLSGRNGIGDHLKKQKKLDEFREKYLKLSNRTYRFGSQLNKCKDNYDVVIVGSDQIWNESFTLRGEFKNTLSYFLDFLPDNVMKISYAASFGFSGLPTSSYIDAVKDSISRFRAISVREEEGAQIVKQFGLNADVVCDPTLLLEKKDYIDTFNLQKDRTGVFAYILQKRQDDAWQTVSTAADYLDCSFNKQFSGSMTEWLNSIMTAELVVTNSFHGTLMSIILNKPFIAITINGSGMNSRLYTLLSETDLLSRLIEKYDSTRVYSIINSDIDWCEVNAKLTSLRQKGRNWLKNHIRER